jgi:hypothetical protein
MEGEGLDVPQDPERPQLLRGSEQGDDARDLGSLNAPWFWAREDTTDDDRTPFPESRLAGRACVDPGDVLARAVNGHRFLPNYGHHAPGAAGSSHEIAVAPAETTAVSRGLRLGSGYSGSSDTRPDAAGLPGADPATRPERVRRSTITVPDCSVGHSTARYRARLAAARTASWGLRSDAQADGCPAATLCTRRR